MELNDSAAAILQRVRAGTGPGGTAVLVDAVVNDVAAAARLQPDDVREDVVLFLEQAESSKWVRFRDAEPTDLVQARTFFDDATHKCF